MEEITLSNDEISKLIIVSKGVKRCVVAQTVHSPIYSTVHKQEVYLMQMVGGSIIKIQRTIKKKK